MGHPTQYIVYTPDSPRIKYLILSASRFVILTANPLDFRKNPKSHHYHHFQIPSGSGKSPFLCNKPAKVTWHLGVPLRRPTIGPDKTTAEMLQHKAFEYIEIFEGQAHLHLPVLSMIFPANHSQQVSSQKLLNRPGLLLLGNSKSRCIRHPI